MIELEGVTKRYGARTVVDDVTLAVAKGDFAVLIGPSGCGKSTILRMMNGLIVPDAGTIRVREAALDAAQSDRLRRSIGYVIQSVGLFPHWSIADNILAVPRLLRWSKPQCAERLDALVELVGIDRALLTRHPSALSGGQQQRIGIARALAADPDIVLMDEPFAALDPVSRTMLQSELQRIHKTSQKTFVFVTHDMDEALRLATQLFILKDGRIVQNGAPEHVLAAPKDAFVTTFLGGSDLPLRRLDHMRVRAHIDHEPGPTGPSVSADDSLRSALAAMLDAGTTRLRVHDANGNEIGSIGLDALVRPKS
jgi:osmoprotectant transport system ATP-binding protein